MKQIFFEKVKQRLIDRVPEIKSIDLFNGQIENEKKENPIQFPACFIEFQSIDWTSKGRGIQQGIAAVKFYIAIETYKTGITGSATAALSDTSILELITKIHVALNGFDDELFTPLARSSEQQDIGHDNVLVWGVVYMTQLTDDGAETRYSKPLVNLIPDTIDVMGLTVDPSLVD